MIPKTVFVVFIQLTASKFLVKPWNKHDGQHNQVQRGREETQENGVDQELGSHICKRELQGKNQKEKQI